jgi:hypothetical protein
MWIIYLTSFDPSRIPLDAAAAIAKEALIHKWDRLTEFLVYRYNIPWQPTLVVDSLSLFSKNWAFRTGAPLPLPATEAEVPGFLEQMSDIFKRTPSEIFNTRAIDRYLITHDIQPGHFMSCSPQYMLSAFNHMINQLPQISFEHNNAYVELVANIESYVRFSEYYMLAENRTDAARTLLALDDERE